ncbi:MAG: HNH endonuclease [Planctomycetes bacterium]|nr:HNH endonuclease [Planctomycetota bacterium]
MSQALRELVRQRAGQRCEYCQLPEEAFPFPFEIDHIIARKHRGATTAENLAWACYSCNAFKGPNIAGLDPASNEFTRLFHPRNDVWHAHFEWNGPIVEARTAIGRTTLDVLELNNPESVQIRRLLIEEGRFPPPA